MIKQRLKVLLKQKKQTPKRPIPNFFKSLTTISYGIAIGIFLGAFILFVILALMQNHKPFVNMAFFTGLGFIVFLMGYGSFLVYGGKFLNDNSLENDQKSKKYLIRSLLVTSVIYLLLAWFLMIMMGTFHDFNLRFIHHPTISVFSANNDFYQTQINGFILFYVTLGLVFFVAISHMFFNQFSTRVYETFKIRRKMVEKVRSEAQKSI